MVSFTTEQQAAIAALAAMNANAFHPATNPGGFAGEGYKKNVPLHAGLVATLADAFADMAGIAQDAANTAISVSVNAPTANSDSTLTVAGSGNKTFHTTTDLQSTSPFRPGMWITAISATDAGKAMWGYIPVGGLDYAADTLTVTVLGSRGSGSVSSWYLFATGPMGTGSGGGLAALVQDTAPLLGGHLSSNGNNITITSGNQLILAGGSGGIDLNGGVLGEAVLQASVETFATLSGAANTVSLSATASNHFHITLGGDVVIQPPSSGLLANLLRPMVLWIKQPPSGGPHDVGWASNVKWIGGSPPPASTTPGATDIFILQGRYNGSTVVYAAQVFGQGWVGL